MTNKIKCPICESKELIKRGVIKTESKGDRQRYGCKKCGKRFIPNEPFFRMRNHDKMITACMDMYYSGMSFRRIQEHLEKFYPNSVNPSTIYRWILKYVPMMENFTDTQKLSVGRYVEGDEVEYHRRISHKRKMGTAKNFFVDIIDNSTRFVISSDYVKDRGTTELSRVYRVAKKRTGDQIKIIATDGLMGYPKTLKKTFGLRTFWKHKKLSKITHRIIRSDDRKFNYRIERFHSTLRERTKTMRGFHGCLTSAQTIMKGFEIYYNFIRKNMALNGKTPSQIAIPNLQLQNKNRWIEIIERGHIENEK